MLDTRSIKIDGVEYYVGQKLRLDVNKFLKIFIIYSYTPSTDIFRTLSSEIIVQIVKIDALDPIATLYVTTLNNEKYGVVISRFNKPACGWIMNDMIKGIYDE